MDPINGKLVLQRWANKTKDKIPMMRVAHSPFSNIIVCKHTKNGALDFYPVATNILLMVQKSQTTTWDGAETL